MVTVMRYWFAAPVAVVALSMPQSPGQSDPQALPRMVASEKAFAAATAELGVRDGFLTFFADDAVQIQRGDTNVALVSLSTSIDSHTNSFASGASDGSPST